MLAVGVPEHNFPFRFRLVHSQHGCSAGVRNAQCFRRQPGQQTFFTARFTAAAQHEIKRGSLPKHHRQDIGGIVRRQRLLVTDEPNAVRSETEGFAEHLGPALGSHRGDGDRDSSRGLFPQAQRGLQS